MSYCCVLFNFPASFYGSSYVNVPYQDAKSTTEISFAFRTKHLDAFLFLAAGKTDYCFVLLEAGKLKVKINLGAGESEISSPRGLRLDDLNWHLVNISRREGDLNLVVDKIHVVRYINYSDYLPLDLKLLSKIFLIS